MKQLEDGPKAALLSILSEMLQEDQILIGLRGANGRDSPTLHPTRSHTKRSMRKSAPLHML